MTNKIARIGKAPETEDEFEAMIQYARVAYQGSWPDKRPLGFVMTVFIEPGEEGSLADLHTIWNLRGPGCPPTSYALTRAASRMMALAEEK